MLFAMQKTDFHVLELFCRASHVRASMHRITSLELLRTLMLCLVQLSKWRECKATDAEKLLSQWEKVANAILRVKLKYMKMFFLMKWNVICNARQKTDFHVLELFCRASHVRASMHRITSLELLRTLMLCLVQLSKWRECKATDAEKLLSQWRKLLNAILRVKLKYMRMFLLMKWNVICNAEDSFHVLELFCRASHVRASMHRITSLELLRTLMLCLCN